MCPGSLEFAPTDGRVGRVIAGIVSVGNWSIGRLLGEVRCVWTVVSYWFVYGFSFPVLYAH